MSWTLDFIKSYRKVLYIPGLIRLWAAVVKRQPEDLHEVVTIRLRKPVGHKIALRPYTNDYYTFGEVFIHEVYRETSVVASRLPVQVVLDLGANIGLSSVYFAARFRSCRIVAVEPYPPNVTILRRNARLCSNTYAFDVASAAASGTAGQVTLSIPRNGLLTDQAFLSSEKDDGLSVSAVTVESLMERHQLETLDICKIDIEGGEVDVFKGNVDWLRRTRVLAVEFHGESRRESRFDQIVQDFGFRVSSSPGHTVVAFRNGE